MKPQYHILNGDSLKEKFPESISGEILVARECLVDGRLDSENLNDFFNTRAEFISNSYDGYEIEDYFKETVSEFNKIQKIPEQVDINLWFEDDLFCQVNLWFVLYLLHQSKKSYSIFLVRPKSHNQYGFGGLSELELFSIYKNRQELKDLETLQFLWKYYQTNDTEQLLNTANQLHDLYAFILPAVKAHIDRLPSDGKPGRPNRSLIQIIDDLGTVEFGPVFKEFCKRESIYGFGDLQVKRLLDEILEQRE